MSKEFAAFIMTYNRPALILEAIDRLLNQTIPPSKILVIDNSESDETQVVMKSISRPEVFYSKTGYNAGPAGAAKIGLSKLVEEGYEWIYWGDDDNPPDFPDSFECLFRLIHRQSTKPGIVGSVGQFFIPLAGQIKRVTDEQLQKSDSIEVDSIAGGQCMIVNALVVKGGILPDESLFFGFEELDFCLKAKKAGYDLLVSSELFLRARQKYGRLDYKRPFYTTKEKGTFKRQYYSTRNMLHILKANKYYVAFGYQLVKGLAKSIYGFRFGWEYGKLNPEC